MEKTVENSWVRVSRPGSDATRYEFGPHEVATPNPWVAQTVPAWDVQKNYKAKYGVGINVPQACPMQSSKRLFQVFSWDGSEYVPAVIEAVSGGFAGGGRLKTVAAFGTLREAKQFVADQGAKVVIKRDNDSFDGTEGVLLGRSKGNSANVDIQVRGAYGQRRVIECHNLFVFLVGSGEWIGA